MTITVELPDEVAATLGKGRPFNEKVLEALAVDGFLSGELSRGQVAELLGLSYHDAESWFARKSLRRDYGPADLEADRAALDRLLGKA